MLLEEAGTYPCTLIHNAETRIATAKMVRRPAEGIDLDDVCDIVKTVVARGYAYASPGYVVYGRDECFEQALARPDRRTQCTDILTAL